MMPRISGTARPISGWHAAMISSSSSWRSAIPGPWRRKGPSIAGSPKDWSPVLGCGPRMSSSIWSKCCPRTGRWATAWPSMSGTRRPERGGILPPAQRDQQLGQRVGDPDRRAGKLERRHELVQRDQRVRQDEAEGTKDDQRPSPQGNGGNAHEGDGEDIEAYRQGERAKPRHEHPEHERHEAEQRRHQKLPAEVKSERARPAGGKMP